VRSRRSGGVQVACDLSEARPGGALGTDAIDDVRRQDSRPSARAGGTLAVPWRPASLGEEPFELVDGDELGAPGQLDQLDIGEDAVEGGAADAECLGRLAARVGESLDFGRRADGYRGLSVAAFLLGSAAMPAA
jgi:hypothetical protein